MVNEQMLIGRVGSEIYKKTFKDGRINLYFTVATDEHYKTDKGEYVDRVEWHRIVCFIQSMCEAMIKILSKGDMVYIVGRTETQKYKKNGYERTVKTVVALRWRKMYTTKTKGGEHEIKGNLPLNITAPSDEFYTESDFEPEQF